MTFAGWTCRKVHREYYMPQVPRLGLDTLTGRAIYRDGRRVPPRGKEPRWQVYALIEQANRRKPKR